MDYKKKSLSRIDVKSDYEEIDTRLASGWYVDINKKKTKTIEKLFFIYNENYCVSISSQSLSS